MRYYIDLAKSHFPFFLFLTLTIIWILSGSCKRTDEDLNLQGANYSEGIDSLLANQPLNIELIQMINDVGLLFDSLDIYARSGNYLSKSRLLVNLANQFRLSGNYTESLEFYREAWNDMIQTSFTKDLAIISHGLASVFFEMYFHNQNQTHFLDSAKVYADIAFDKASETNDDSYLIADALNVLGAVEVYRENYDEAIEKLLYAIQLKESADSEKSLPAVTNIAYAYYKAGQFQKSLRFAKDGYITALEMGNFIFAAINLQTLVLVNQVLGDEQSVSFYDKLLGQYKDEKEVMVQSLIMKQQLLNHRIRQDQNKLSGLKKERFLLFRLSWIMSGGLLLLVIILLLLLYNIKQYKRTRMKEDELRQERERIMRLELQNTSLKLQARESESKLLQVEIESRNMALASKLLNLSKLNGFLSSLQKELSIILSLQKNEQNKTNDLLSRINKKIIYHINEDVWKEFELLYATGNTSAIRNIAENHSDLTANEKRLCYLIITGLTTKEISDIMSKSYRSVEMARHRLREKLGIDRDSSLHEYLMKYVK